MPQQDVVIRIAGEAGEGIQSTGQLLAQAAARAGFRILTDFVPPAEIKGGNSLYQVRLSQGELHHRGDVVDILMAFTQEAYDVNIVYGRRKFVDKESGITSVPEILLIDVSRFDKEKIGVFKFQLWKSFGIDSSKYENIWDFEQYVRLAQPALAALHALGVANSVAYTWVNSSPVLGLTSKPAFSASALNCGSAKVWASAWRSAAARSRGTSGATA